MSELLYVGWGGSGRTATLRAALERAAVSNAGLVYLAVLDEDHFGDLDPTMTRIVEEELLWLLETEVDLAKSQTGHAELETRVLLRGGDVIELTVDTTVAAGVHAVLIGSPVSPVGSLRTAEAVADAISAGTRLPTHIL